MTTTITEALAEIKTIDARVMKKMEFVFTYLGRLEKMKDPLEKDGGSVRALAQERQAIDDLLKRRIAIRTAIQKSNLVSPLTIEGVTQSIAEWLTWRREVAPALQNFLDGMVKRLNLIRAEVQSKQRGSLVQASAQVGSTEPNDVVINIDELALGAQRESLETILGVLDGLLSLKNATTFIDV